MKGSSFYYFMQGVIYTLGYIGLMVCVSYTVSDLVTYLLK